MEEGDRVVHTVGEPGQGGTIELIVNREEDQGAWR